ncbi:MAG TPA: hypothetical protein VI121_06795, partial [Agromyces sp.]
TKVSDPEHGVTPGAAFDGGYRMPGGDHAFLEDLARLEGPDQIADAMASVDAPDARARAREARAPGLAVLVDPSEQEAGNLVALRPLFEPAVAFVTDRVSRAVLDLLEEADWRIVGVRRSAGIASAWSGIAATTRADAAAMPPSRDRADGAPGVTEEAVDAP